MRRQRSNTRIDFSSLYLLSILPSGLVFNDNISFNLALDRSLVSLGEDYRWPRVVDWSFNDKVLWEPRQPSGILFCKERDSTDQTAYDQQRGQNLQKHQQP